MRRTSARRHPRARHARRMGRVKRTLVTLGVLVGLVVGSAGGAVAYYVHRLDGNIHRLQIVQDLGTNRPQKKQIATSHGTAAPVDILVMGSDTRAGDNSFVGGNELDARSDTTILLHISADRKTAVGVSIPRDSMVHIPDCKDSKGRTIPARVGLSMFNSAFTLGGPGCTVKTVEQTTGVHIDHFVVVDFHGFRDMVNALGGVSVCVPVAVDDNTHHIHLAAGRNKLNGNQALQYVRARYMLGDGSDVQRTERQQLFIGAMIRKALGEGLTRPDRLLSFLDAATKSLTTDMSFGQLRTLAQQVEGIGLDKILFATVPTTAYPADPNRLIWTDAAPAIWQGLIDDTGLPGHKRAGATPSPSATSTPTPVVSVAPTAVRVRVVGGTGSLAHARAAADALRARGFVVTSVTGGTNSSVPTTLVRYNPGYDQSARTLHSSLPGSQEQVAPELGRTLEVVVGSDYTQVVKVRVKASPTPSARSASSAPLSVRTALTDGCAPAASTSASPSAVAGG